MSKERFFRFVTYQPPYSEIGKYYACIIENSKGEKSKQINKHDRKKIMSLCKSIRKFIHNITKGEKRGKE